MRIRELAAVRVSYGYRRLHVLLRREGWKVNHKLVYRIYREEGLEVRTKKRRKRASALRVVLPAATSPNERWSMDFVSDSLHDGRRFRVLTLVDHFSRVSPAIEVGSSITGKRVVAVLERLVKAHGLPRVITTDNGTEFTSRAVDEWAHRSGVKLDFIRPGKPIENAYIESFNGRLRQECLNQCWFSSLEDAKIKIEAWRIDYNEQRPHTSLGNQTPEQFESEWQLSSTPKEGIF
jgi:putative transposase